MDSYDEAYQELQSILEQLRENKISIDDLEPKMKRAKELVNYCQTKLRTIAGTIDGMFDGE